MNYIEMKMHRFDLAPLNVFKRWQLMSPYFLSKKEKSGVITREQTNLWVPLGVQEQDVRLIFA